MFFIPSCSGSCISLMKSIPTNCQIKKSNRKEEEVPKRKKGRKQEQVCLFSNDVCARPFKTREEARIVTALKRKHLDRGHFNSIDLDTHTQSVKGRTPPCWRSKFALYEEGASPQQVSFRIVCFHPTPFVKQDQDGRGGLPSLWGLAFFGREQEEEAGEEEEAERGRGGGAQVCVQCLRR